MVKDGPVKVCQWITKKRRRSCKKMTKYYSNQHQFTPMQFICEQYTWVRYYWLEKTLWLKLFDWALEKKRREVWNYTFPPWFTKWKFSVQPQTTITSWRLLLNQLFGPAQIVHHLFKDVWCKPHQRISSAAIIWPRLFAACHAIACFDYNCYPLQCKIHHTGMHSLRVKSSTITQNTPTTASTHTCNWQTATAASLKGQPEKKDALLMRRSGPCSEKARRGLQSWENPVQHKQKYWREKEGKRDKNMNHD